MKDVAGNRGSGKTTQALKLAQKTGAILLVNKLDTLEISLNALALRMSPSCLIFAEMKMCMKAKKIWQRALVITNTSLMILMRLPAIYYITL